uniref:Uncharacterized protein n=1 Tax=Arundo donax TaxID=35708 RepID=A0A0A9FB83_ARUDO
MQGKGCFRVGKKEVEFTPRLLLCRTVKMLGAPESHPQT